MITRSTILIRCVCDQDDTHRATLNAIERVLDLTSERFMVRSDTDGRDVSIEIDFDGDAAVGEYNETLLSFLPFMVDNVETDFRFMEKDRYEVRDQNGDVLKSSNSWAEATSYFRYWCERVDRSNEGAGIYDNQSGTMVLTLRFDEDED